MEQTPPLISVIIPCYNQAQYLPDALESVLAQTYPHWECIIVNDGSPDNTEEVSEKWLSKDRRFRYFRKENGGLSSARNAGLNIAQGDYIQFLDADDLIHPKKLSIQVRELSETSGYSLSISDYFSSTESDIKQAYPGRYISPQFKTNDHLAEIISDWEFSLSIPVHCFLFKTSLFKDHHIIFNEHLPNHEDWECWMNIFRLNPVVRFVDVKLATYRIREDAMCYDRKLMKKGFLKAVEIQLKTFNSKSEEYRLLIRKINQIKYGISSNYFIWIIIVMFYKKSRSLAARILRRLKILSN